MTTLEEQLIKVATELNNIKESIEHRDIALEKIDDRQREDHDLLTKLEQRINSLEDNTRENRGDIKESVKETNTNWKQIGLTTLFAIIAAIAGALISKIL